jgi:hypothetical protein
MLNQHVNFQPLAGLPSRLYRPEAEGARVYNATGLKEESAQGSPFLQERLQAAKQHYAHGWKPLLQIWNLKW